MCKYSKTLRSVGKKIDQRYDITLNAKANDLFSARDEDDDIRERFRRTLDVFVVDDEQRNCNWGRVVMIYVFAARLAERCYLHGQHRDVDDLIEMTGSYVAENLSSWIEEQGGWVGNLFLFCLIHPNKIHS